MKAATWQPIEGMPWAMLLLDRHKRILRGLRRTVSGYETYERGRWVYAVPGTIDQRDIDLLREMSERREAA